MRNNHIAFITFQTFDMAWDGNSCTLIEKLLKQFIISGMLYVFIFIYFLNLNSYLIILCRFIFIIKRSKRIKRIQIFLIFETKLTAKR